MDPNNSRTKSVLARLDESEVVALVLILLEQIDLLRLLLFVCVL